MKFNKWMVYFLNCKGLRDGNEYINAETKEEAIDIYVRFFNVLRSSVVAIPVVGKE